MSARSPAAMSLRVCAVAMSFVAVILILPAGAAAQSDRSYWGVGASFVPNWKSENTFRDLLFVEADGQLEGREFSIGLVRGSTRGGDWGLSFVHKPIKNTSLVSSSSDCSEGSCFSNSETTILQNVRLRGIEFHGFFAFVTIKNRAQIGLNVAGGVATIEGTVEQTFFSTNSFTLPNGQVQTFEQTDTEIRPAKEAFAELHPLGKVELQGAVILAPGLKVKVSGGFNYPGTGFRIGAIYLIGAQ